MFIWTNDFRSCKDWVQSDSWNKTNTFRKDINKVFLFKIKLYCCTIYLHKISDPPKGGKQAPKVAKKVEKRSGKKGGKIGGSSEKKRNRRRKECYGIYIYNVLRQVHPDVGISSKAMSIMNHFWMTFSRELHLKHLAYHFKAPLCYLSPLTASRWVLSRVFIWQVELVGTIWLRSTRTNRWSYCLCQGLDSMLKHLD